MAKTPPKDPIKAGRAVLDYVINKTENARLKPKIKKAAKGSKKIKK